jgi:hypothetical protein
MHSRFAGFLPTAALLVGLLAQSPFATAIANAQGFGSVSSQPVAAPAQTAPAALRDAMPAPAASGFFSSSTPQPAPLPAPSAQVAALGFSSISGMSTTDVAQGGSPGAAGSAGAYEMADRIVVHKGARKLELFRGGRVIAQYPIKLGMNPFGHKRQEGDFRTPEGRYTINRRNPQSEFYLSIQVSYPNQEDAAVARERGVSPGGLIMIHGQPNVPTRPPEWYATRDWTDGCIALSNAHMTDVWLRTPLGTPIEILP